MDILGELKRNLDVFNERAKSHLAEYHEAEANALELRNAIKKLEEK